MASLATATVNRPIACQIKHDREEAFKKARNGELTLEEEIKLLTDMVNTKVQDGVFSFEVPFKISDKAHDKVAYTMHHYVKREENKSTISLLETPTLNRQIVCKIKHARDKAFEKAQKGELTIDEERKLLIDMINSKVADGILMFEVPFYISDRAYEMVYSMLYYVRREYNKTAIGVI